MSTSTVKLNRESTETVHQVMMEEWENLQREQSDLPPIPFKRLKRSSSLPDCTTHTADMQK